MIKLKFDSDKKYFIVVGICNRDCQKHESNLYSTLANYYMCEHSDEEIADIPSHGIFNNQEYPVCEIAQSAFSNCPHLKIVRIPDTIKVIEWNMLYHDNLCDIEVHPNNPNYCSVDGVLYSKDKKELIAFPPAKNTSYDVLQGVLHIKHFAFKGCRELSQLTLPQSLTQIEECVFYRCMSLETVVIPDNVLWIKGNKDGNKECYSHPKFIYKGKTYDSEEELPIYRK